MTDSSASISAQQLRNFVDRIEEGEEWRPVLDAPDYQISSLGRVRCAVRRRYLKPGDLVSLNVLKDGRIFAELDGKKRSVHRLVCRAFHGDAPSLMHEVAHNNGNPANNAAGNVRWATHKENCADKKLHGTENPPRGEKQGRSKLRADQVKEIRRRIDCGEGVMAISREFRVSHGAIGLIKSGRNWAHV